MPLIGLLLVLLLAGMLISRQWSGNPVNQPRPAASAGPAPERQAQQAVDAASQAERQRLEDAMKALNPDGKP